MTGSVAHFAGFHREWQYVFLGRQWACGVGSECAGWIVGPVEIKIHFSVFRQRSVEHAAELVGFGFAGGVFKQEEESVAFVNRPQVIALACVIELDDAGTLFHFRLPKDIQNRNLLDVRNEFGLETEGWIDRKILETGKALANQAGAIFDTDAQLVAPLYDI